MYWTDLMKGLLTGLWATDQPTRDIAKELGVTKNAIIGQAHRLNLPSRMRIKRGPLKGTPRKRKSGPIMEAVDNSPAKIERKGGIHPSKLFPVPRLELPATGDGIAFLNLQRHHCRAIIGKDADERGHTRSCGAQVLEGKSYCPYHHNLYHYRGERVR